jgi:hypothetical protein
MSNIDEWTDLVTESETPVEYLVSAGAFGAEANGVVDAAGITSVDDFVLLDEALLRKVIEEAGLKPIPAKKLSNAYRHGERERQGY